MRLTGAECTRKSNSLFPHTRLLLQTSALALAWEVEQLRAQPVSTTEQLADVMTKILGRELFVRFRDIITSDMDLTKL